MERAGRTRTRTCVRCCFGSDHSRLTDQTNWPIRTTPQHQWHLFRALIFIEPSEVAPHLCAGHHAHQLQLIFIFIWSDTHHITRLSSVRATGVTGHTNTLSTVVQTRFILLFKFYHAAPDKLENTTQAPTTDRRTVCLEAEQNEMWQYGSVCVCVWYHSSHSGTV